MTYIKFKKHVANDHCQSKTMEIRFSGNTRYFSMSMVNVYND